MNVKFLSLKSISLLIVILVIGISAGAFTFAVVNSKSDYPKNASGQTYGSALKANSTEEVPDLIEAYGIDDTFGYVKVIDLDRKDKPRNPKEAKEYQSKLKDRIIPLYDADGKTVIGKFKISNEEALQRATANIENGDTKK